MHPEVLVPLFTFLAVIGLGGSFIIALSARRAPLRARLLGLERQEEPGRGRRPRWVEWVEGLGRAVSGKGLSQGLQQELAQAGYHQRSAGMLFLPLLLASGMSPQLQLLLALSLGAALSFLPNLALRIRREKRRGEIRLNLPYAIDLLEICVSSGMGLDMAWNAVADEVRHMSPVLADEMALTNLEIHLGADRAQALRHMAERTGAEELSSLVATLLQSEKFGTSIAEALKAFAAFMRSERSQRAEEAAEKMAVKLLFPMVVFIFPSMLIVVCGSAFLEILRTLGGGS
jgi:tight adherence protein C